MQPTASKHVLDRTATEAHRKKLTPSDHPVLPRRDPGDAGTPWAV
jgi:hypothetical protein